MSPYRRFKLLFIVTFNFLMNIMNLSATTVNVTLQTLPTVFGETAKITCRQVGSELGDIKSKTRLWYGGKNTRLLIFNGISTNSAKYFEVIEDFQTSTLMIYNFNESDVNCDYSCTVNFDIVQVELVLKPAQFIFIPTENMIQVKITQENQDIRILVTVEKVYPIPSCFARMGQTNMTLAVLAKDNGIFFNASVNETLHVNDSSIYVDVSCKLGSRTFWSFKVEQNKSHLFHIPHADYIAGLIATVVLIVAVSLYYNIKNFRKKCVFWFTSSKPLSRTNLVQLSEKNVANLKNEKRFKKKEELLGEEYIGSRNEEN